MIRYGEKEPLYEDNWREYEVRTGRKLVKL